MSSLEKWTTILPSINNDRSKEIDDLLKKVEPRFKKAFETGLKSVAENISLSEIEAAIRSGDLTKAAALINELIVGTAFIEFSGQITQAVIDGGAIAARWAFTDPVKANRIEFALSVTDSNTARFIEQYRANKIRQVTNEIQDTIGRVVLDGVNNGVNPRIIAREVKDSIGLTSRQHDAVKNFERLLRDRKKEALSRAIRDKRFDRTVLNAINNQRDLTEDQIKRMVDRYRERYIKSRSTTIARTEAIRLVSYGNDQFWNQAVSNGIVNQEQIVRRWIPTYDGKLREAHASIPRLNPDGVGMNEPFRSTLGPIMRPGDPSAGAANTINCRCAVWTRITS